MEYFRMLKSLIWNRYVSEFLGKPLNSLLELSVYLKWLNSSDDIDFSKRFSILKFKVIVTIVLGGLFLYILTLL